MIKKKPNKLKGNYIIIEGCIDKKLLEDFKKAFRNFRKASIVKWKIPIIKKEKK